MLVYIIDGFNLIHRLKELKNSSTPHRDLIHYLKNRRLTGSRNNKVIIVFDGKLNWEAKKEVTDFELVFSGSISADEVIEQRVEKIKNRSEVIVVSDDRQVRQTSKTQGARDCRIADFIREKAKNSPSREQKQISYLDQREITEELRRIWLKSDQ